MKQKVKKLILTLTAFLVIFNVITPNVTYAASGWGGIIFEPISFFVCGLGDAIMNITQKIMLPGTVKAIKNREDGIETTDESRSYYNQIRYCA